MEKRHGIALIIVLAFLTILVLLGVTFVTLMRTERVASRNYVDTVHARHFVHTGFARAIDDIELQLGGATPRYPSAWQNRSFFSEAFTHNLGENEEIHQVGTATLRSYFPYDDTVWGNVVTAISGGASEWQEILDPLPPSTDFFGRVSYWIFDCSGLLDVTAIHAAGVARGLGVDPGEIRLSDQMPGVDDPDRLADNVSFYRRYASVAELAQLGQRILPPPPPRSFLQMASPASAPGFINFSHFPSSYPHPTNSASIREPIYIGSLASIRANRSSIEEVLQWPEYGLSPAQAEVFYANLVDYCDPDRLPASEVATVGLNSICTEAVPMINEVSILNRVSVQPSGVAGVIYRNVLDVEVELWYPFPHIANADSYTLTCLIQPSPSGANPFMPVFADPLDSVVVFTDPWPGAAERFRTHEFRAINNLLLPVGDPAPAMPPVVRITLRLTDSGGNPVDELIINESWAAPYFVDSMTMPVAPGPVVVSGTLYAKECVDPRINGDWTNPDQWALVTATSMGSINPSADTGPTGYSAAGKDGTWEMHVANGNIQNVGELGYLLYREDRPWQTVPLVGPNAWPVWRDFTVNDPPLQRGFVNPNSPVEDVIAAILHQWTPERFPGVPIADTEIFEWADAEELADRIVPEDRQSGPANPEPDENAEIRWGVIGFPEDAFDSLLGGSSTRLDQKALLRTVGDLLSTRQQVFTIVVEAEVLGDVTLPRNFNTSPIRDYEILARQKALAVIWRDPFGVEPTFTQYFEWLTD